jgi:hypothetical protein
LDRIAKYAKKPKIWKFILIKWPDLLTQREIFSKIKILFINLMGYYSNIQLIFKSTSKSFWFFLGFFGIFLGFFFFSKWLSSETEILVMEKLSE